MAEKFVTIIIRDDGTIKSVLVWEGVPQEGIEVTDFIEVNDLINDPDIFIYKDGQVRRRTDDEIHQRVKEVYDIIKDGKGLRCKGDLIERYSHFFTTAELEEVETIEEIVQKLLKKVKLLEEKIK